MFSQEVNKIAQAVASTTGWDSSTSVGSPGYDQSLNNSSGFNALPGGLRVGSSSNPSNNSFVYEGLIGCIWSSSAWGALSDAWSVALGQESDHFAGLQSLKKDGYFVRLIRGEE